MNAAIGWALAAIFLNYLIFSTTGFPALWCFISSASAPLAYYAAVVNLGLTVGIIAGGLWYGPIGAVKAAVLMLGFNLVPSVMEALMGFGYRCG